MPRDPAIEIAEKLKSVVGKEIKEPQVAELAAHWFHLAGGPRAVAKLLLEEFRTAKPGSMIRQRILDMILRSAKFGNEQNRGVGDLGLLTDADLEREMASLIGELKEDLKTDG